MKIKFKDFNEADGLFAGGLSAQWVDVNNSLLAMPLQLKPSDQSGKEGEPIFDPVASNAEIKTALQGKGWNINVEIPQKVNFLGKHVDFFKDGVLVEVQFSNYPFFLNNVVRSGLLAKSETLLSGQKVRAVVIITKAHLFPSSNSTLYYEQAIRQLEAFTKYGVFDIPIRVVGLHEDENTLVSAKWHEYPNRYSRVPSSSMDKQCKLLRKDGKRSLCSITFEQTSLP